MSALALEHIAKRFGAVEALVDASIFVRPGTVHALLGENGAGKTTLMRVAFGMVRADAGVIRIDGKEVQLSSPGDAIRRRLGMVHQHFTSVPALTVAENVALGGSGRFRVRNARERVMEIGRETGLVLDPDAHAGSLGVSAGQRLEIVKALAHGARTLILDEPTGALAPAEVDSLMLVLRRLAEFGSAVVIITHKLKEALTVADDVTVLRKGLTVASMPARGATEEFLATAMLGGYPSAWHREQSHGSPAEVAISARSLRANGVRNATLDVRRGEIVGVAGVEGAGQRELLRVLAGRARISGGELDVRARSVAFVPEDRQHEGLIPEFRLVENVALRGAGKMAAWQHMHWPGMAARTAELMARFSVRAEGPHTIAADLSGGNQQRLVLARELADHPDLLVVENPARGLDIAATAFVYAHLRAARDSGAAVVMYSSDLDEVLSLADRAVVMYGGILREVTPPFDRESVGRAMLGLE